MTPRASGDAVLLLTHSGDLYTVDLVSEALERRGARPLRLNTDLFPASIKLSARAGDGRPARLVTEEGAQSSAGEVRAVWARKLWAPRLGDDLEERFRQMCARESAAALEGFLDALHDARWVNDLQRQAAAENKQRQLRVPRTLVTNDPAAAREFFADAEGLRHSPMVFQELVPKECELRVAWVAGEGFTGALDASGTSRGQTDWRRAAPAECRWQAAELPAEVSLGLGGLMSQLGLVFGAVDLIRTPAGGTSFWK